MSDRIIRGAPKAPQAARLTFDARAPAVREQARAERVYSYRNASIGSRRDALNAGYIPKKIPTPAEKPRPIANDHHGSDTGKQEAQCMMKLIDLPSAITI